MAYTCICDTIVYVYLYRFVHTKSLLSGLASRCGNFWIWVEGLLDSKEFESNQFWMHLEASVKHPDPFAAHSLLYNLFRPSLHTEQGQPLVPVTQALMSSRLHSGLACYPTPGFTN